ncbi:hypothetical protein C7R93_01795 [Brevibacillus fortis]|uniref:Uncharacterized protein n=1 Tax=Brevibacillus fortis TaxID=2126352 RepID=A0A2P7VNK1_9BACL|nr:hypothetical protein C7R93_01795 [Brevibacillus fortis]
MLHCTNLCYIIKTNFKNIVLIQKWRNGEWTAIGVKETANKIAQNVEALVMMPTERLATIAWEMGMYAAAIAVAAGIRSKDIFFTLAVI